MVRARRIAALSCAAVLVLPASAIAGGAGDDQYQDPFADPAPQAEAPAQQQQDEQPAAPSATTGSPAPQAEAAPAASGATLPRTGADEGLTAVAGGVLLLAGLALRRRAADDVPH